MRHHSLFYLVLTTVLVALPGHSGAACGQSTDTDRATAVKAGMIVNFLRYTTWPEEAFAEDTSPIVVTVVGDTGVDEVLEAATRDETVQGRRVEVRRLAYPATPEGRSAPRPEDLSAFNAAMRRSHAVFIADTERGRVPEVLQGLKGSSVLTVGESDGFAGRGGMIGFTARSGRIAFEANPGAIRDADLRLSSQVLKLATIVEAEKEKPEGSR